MHGHMLDLLDQLVEGDVPGFDAGFQIRDVALKILPYARGNPVVLRQIQIDDVVGSRLRLVLPLGGLVWISLPGMYRASVRRNKQIWAT